MLQNNIRRLRLQKKLTQEDMATALHMSQNAYSHIESGKTRLIDEERIKAIAHTLGVGIPELFEGNDVVLNFHEKVENGYATYVGNLHTDKDLLTALKEQLAVKDEQIAQLLRQQAALIAQLGK